MNETRFATFGITIADLCAAGLEIPVIGDGRNFQPFLAAGCPDFHIVADTGVETKVSGALCNDAVVQSKQFRCFAGSFQHPFMFFLAFFRQAVAVHFDFIKLMSAFDAAHIATGTHLFPAEAGRVGSEAHRQLCFINNFAHVKPGKRDFSSRNHPEIFLYIMIEVIGEFRQLSCTIKDFTFDHERQVAFLVSLLFVQVQHISNQSAFQLSALSIQHIEAGSGKLGSAVKIHNAEVGTQIPVRLILKFMLKLHTKSLDDLVFRITDAIRNLFIRDVRDIGDNVLQFFFCFFGLFVQFGNAVTDHFHGSDTFLAFGRIFSLADGFGFAVAFGFQCFCLAQQFAAGFVQFKQAVDIFNAHLSVAHGFFYKFRIFTNQCNVQHFYISSG